MFKKNLRSLTAHSEGWSFAILTETIGNTLKAGSWHDIANNLSIQTHAQYDNFGNLRKAWDANGNLTQTDYSSTYAYAYPTSVTTPIPDPTGTHGSSTAFTTSTTYDYNTGLPLTITDPNGAVTEMEYDDPLLRPTKVTAANGQETITEYGAGTSAATRWVKVKTQIDATNWKEAISWFDGLGRTIKSQSIDTQNGDVFAETEYDNMGRVKKVSNPYRTGDTKFWTENFYDAAGRLFKVKTPDDAEVETTYGLATSGSCLGTTVIVEDQADKVRRSLTNALGQLCRVDEPDANNQLGAVNSPNQDTSYTYDTLNNLTTVNQGVQTRTFSYDALSRLESATNPESGTINYTYDDNGNLATKTDARSITTTYAYDGLNRVVTRSYSDSTPDVGYFYDNLTNAKGKLIKVQNSVSTTEYTSFDILGRVTAHKQTTDGEEYATEYTYNLSGALIEETYPSGRKVKNTLDDNGDLSMVQSKKDSGDFYHPYASNFAYNAAGAVTAMKLGNGRWESTQFNSRLQPTMIGLGSGPTSQNLLKLEYSYGTTANNGNVLSQTITVPGAAHPFVQTYSYDELNRISTAEETSNSVQVWKQAFTYDRYGNRNFDEEETTTLPKACLDGGNPIVCAAERKFVNPEILASNNRIKTDQDGDSVDDYVFDSGGNTTKDVEGRTFVYDAENKQVSVSDANGTIGEYFYDGDGKRIKKIVPSTGEVTVFVYDAAGKLIGEYSTVVASPQDAKVAYLTVDNLGSPRINTDQYGAVIARHDYHPFGEEIFSVERTTTLGYAADTIRKQFTGYERDDETDLDYAKARMFGSGVGRFTSPDDFRNDTRAIDPSSWNLYAYVRNNPLKFIDPNGMYIWGRTLGGSKSDEELNKTKKGRKIVDRRNKIRNAINTAQGLSAEVASRQGLSAAEFARIQRAASSFGAADSNNGVTIEFGNIAGAAIANVGWAKNENNEIRAFSEMTNANGDITGVQANLVVAFESLDDAVSLVDSVVHEGGHLADRQALASEFYQKGYVNGEGNYDPATSSLNLTQYQTENRAYHTESDYVRYRQGENALWQNSWTAEGVDTVAQRQAAINQIIRDNYKDSQNRDITPTNEGDKFYRWQVGQKK